MSHTNKLEILHVSSSNQEQAKLLILEGLKDRFGWIDYSLNPDLDGIVKNYIKPEQIFLTGWIGGLLVATGALIREKSTSNKNLKTARIVRMSVSRDYRRMGIAGEILKKLEEYARNFGYHQILLETNWDWESAVKFYRKNNYIEYKKDSTDIHFKKQI